MEAPGSQTGRTFRDHRLSKAVACIALRRTIPEFPCSPWRMIPSGFVIEVALSLRIISDMRLALLFLLVAGGLFQSGCASNPNDPDQVQLGPSIREQQRDARQKEEFARDLPKP